MIRIKIGVFDPHFNSIPMKFKLLLKRDFVFISCRPLIKVSLNRPQYNFIPFQHFSIVLYMLSIIPHTLFIEGVPAIFGIYRLIFKQINRLPIQRYTGNSVCGTDYEKKTQLALLGSTVFDLWLPLVICINYFIYWD